MTMHTLAFLLSAGMLLAQGPQFEVATVRVAQPVTPQDIPASSFRVGMRTVGNQVDFGYLSLQNLIALAYEVKSREVVGPDWIRQQRYDIQALMPEGADSTQIPAMLQALLKERLNLVARKESREQQVYGLEVAKGGQKMKESPAEPKEPADVPGVPVSPPKVSRSSDGRMQYEYERMTMADLAYTLTPMLDLPVVDRTGLRGSYQVALELNATLPNAPGRGANTATLAPSSLLDPFETVQKLGLRLEKQKAAIETVVVESADKTPTAN